MSLLEKEWFIEAPWGRLCIIAWGECSSPPVLLCHGAVDSAATFRPLVKLLPKDFYYIAVELPGNGRSDRYPAGLMVSVYDLVYVLELVVRHFRWERFRFVGHSMGSLLGVLYERSYPGKISHIVNLDPVTALVSVPADQFAKWYNFYFTKYYEKYEELNMPKERGPLYTWKEAVDKLVQKREITVTTAEDTLHRITEPAGGGKIRFTFDQRMKLVTYQPMSPETIKNIYTTFKPATLSIIAENSLKRGNYKDTLFMLDESEYPLKNYRVRRVNGGHDVHLTNPERSVGYVGQFLLYSVEGLDSKPKL